MVWFIIFLIAPLIIVIIYSFATKGMYGQVLFRFTTANYTRSTEFIYLKILWSSFKLAFLTTCSCLLIGYPIAYVMATSLARVRAILLTLIIIPFWTNLVVRTYAIKILLITESDFAVWFGMLTNYLPFMVLPLYVTLEKFDFSLLEAARDLGATPLQVLWNILLPLTKPGIITGMIFVFTPALGEFVIPDLLGGARTMLIGNLITEQFLKTRNWPFGSALSLLLIVMVLGSLFVYLRYIEPATLNTQTPSGQNDH